MAVLYGADAVYLAGTSFGMRSFAGNFSPEALAEAVDYAHAHGVRTHVTVNTLARNDELDRLPAHLRLLNDCGVDCLIVADLGAFRMAQKYAPRCELHVSTQVSVSNYESARAWHELGAKRIVLAREISLEEIREIRAKTPPELELEVFCHGAMCVSWSGRCVLSNYDNMVITNRIRQKIFGIGRSAARSNAPWCVAPSSPTSPARSRQITTGRFRMATS